MKKILFLFLALLFPVLIFIFLKSFGKNEFEVPILFTDSVTVPVTCKAYAYDTPYSIEDTVLQKLSWNKNDSLTVIVFEDQDRKNQHERVIQLNRIFTEFKNGHIRVIRILEKKEEESAEMNYHEKSIIVSVDKDELIKIRSCVFLMSPSNDAVVIDRYKRIRGHYNLLKREDADRMIMQEMNILLKRY